MPRGKLLDGWSLAVAVATFLLFVGALFVKGLTHDLFLEAGVFLVSVKIIMLSHRNYTATRDVDEKLEQVLAAMGRADGHSRTVQPASQDDSGPTRARG